MPGFHLVVEPPMEASLECNGAHGFSEKPLRLPRRATFSTQKKPLKNRGFLKEDHLLNQHFGVGLG